MKLKFTFYAIAMSIAVLSIMSNSSGRQGNWSSAPGDTGTCGTCHTTSGVGTIILDGAPTAYEAGETYDMTLTLTQGAGVVGGFQLVATDGTGNGQMGTFVPAAGTKLASNNRLIQSTPKTFSGGAVSWDVSWTAPSTGAPDMVNFFFSGNAANGNGSNGSGDISLSGSTGNINLPVEWGGLKLRENRNKTINIEWNTLSELNTEKYEILRKTDRVRDFEVIYTQEALGSEGRAQSYVYQDKVVDYNTAIYYQIRSIDLDGYESLTDISTITVKSKTSDWKIYPNPSAAGNNITIQLDSALDQITELTVFRSDGQLVHKNIINPSRDGAIVTLDNVLTTKGIYIARFVSENNEVQTKRIIVTQ